MRPTSAASPIEKKFTKIITTNMEIYMNVLYMWNSIFCKYLTENL